MEEPLKKDMEQLCKDLGLNMTTAFTIFAKKMCRERRIPFDVSIDDPFYSEENTKRILDAVTSLNNGGGVYHDLIEDEE